MTMSNRFKRLLIGRPMKSGELEGEKLSKLKALAVLSSDALSSVAYGTEQILLVLMAAGFAAVWYSVRIFDRRTRPLINSYHLLSPDHLRLSQGRRCLYCRQR